MLEELLKNIKKTMEIKTEAPSNSRKTQKLCKKGVIKRVCAHMLVCVNDQKLFSCWEIMGELAQGWQ